MCLRWYVLWRRLKYTEPNPAQPSTRLSAKALGGYMSNKMDTIMRYKNVQNKYFQIVRPSLESQFIYIVLDAIMVIIVITLIVDFINPPLFIPYTFSLLQLLFLITIIVITIIINTYSILITKLIFYTSGIEYIGIGFNVFAKWKEIKGIHKYGRYKQFTNLLLKDSKIETTFIPKGILRWLNYDKRIRLTRFERYWEQTNWGEYLYKKSKITYWREV
jgi:hypothetical protein